MEAMETRQSDLNFVPKKKKTLLPGSGLSAAELNRSSAPIS